MLKPQGESRSQPAVLLVSDLPTWGRVALASAVPLVEAAGYQACCLPTALLSTHGAYPNFILESQTPFLTRAWNHLKTLDLNFAAVAIGFVGEEPQFALIEEIARAVKAGGGLVLVDPILGDNGHRYGLFSGDYVPAFRSLVALADIITPNLTEAALLLGEDLQHIPDSAEEIDRWVTALGALGPKKVVLTSAPFPGASKETGVAWFDSESGRRGTFRHRRLGKGVPGTGDALAARLLSGLLRGRPFSRAVKLAVKGTLSDLRRSEARGRPALWGPEGPLRP